MKITLESIIFGVAIFGLAWLSASILEGWITNVWSIKGVRKFDGRRFEIVLRTGKWVSKTRIKRTIYENQGDCRITQIKLLK